MKLTLTLLSLTIFAFSSSFGQEQDPEFDNLVRLGEVYSKNVNATGEEFKISVEKLRTPGLTHIIDALILIGKGDKKLLSKEFLSKPAEKELKYWYVLREINYNQSKENARRPGAVVAKETLEKQIDKYWLLDNYYFRIKGGIGMLFNTENLNNSNIDLNDYGLENDTEKAILFFAVTDALARRFQVLHMMKNYDKLIEFTDKLPTFNGKPYYTYTAFNFDDFDWVGYDKTDSYKKIHLGNLYGNLYSHLLALTQKNQLDKFREVYFNSILYAPDYFKYSGDLEKDLKKLYKQAKP